MNRSALAFIILAALLPAVIGSGAVAQTPADTAARIDSVFARYDRTDAPGCVCGVIRDGDLLFAKAYGMANLELDVPLSPSSVLGIGSIAKQFTATSIALLALRGEVDLDTDIRTYLPEMDGLGARITVRQLLHHTSGIRDHLELHWLVGWTNRDYFDNARSYELLTKQNALNFEPGSRYMYSNSNYLLLAEIVRQVSGQSLAEFADANIFAPLGMTDTRFDDDHRRVVKNRATGYWPREGGGWERLVGRSDGVGDVGVSTTAGDLARWDANFTDPKVGGDSFLHLILTRGLLANGDTLISGFGLTHRSYRGLPTVDSDGSWRGFLANLTRFPTERLSVAVLCNAAQGSVRNLTRRVADIFLDPPPEIAAAESAAPASTRRDSIIEVPEPELRKFIGWFWDPVRVMSRRVEERDGALFVVSGNGRAMPLAPIGTRTFVVLGAPIRVLFAFNEDATGLMRTQGNDPPVTMERYQPAFPTESELDAYTGTYTSEEGLADLRVTRDGGTLILHVLRYEPIEMRPVMADRFAINAGVAFSISFERSDGRVAGLVLDGSRIFGVRFAKRGQAAAR